MIIRAEMLAAGPSQYNPTIRAVTTQLSLGPDGEAIGLWYRDGLWVSGWARFLASGTGASGGTGDVRVSLPWPVDTSVINVSTTLGAAPAIGVARMRHATGANSRTLDVQPSAAREVLLGKHASNTPLVGADLGAADAAWRLALEFSYPVAASEVY